MDSQAKPIDVSDVNTISNFLSHPQLPSLATSSPVDCITICASSVLLQATLLFETLEAHPGLTKTLVLCGGIGHSTPLIYQAIAKHPTYHTLEVNGLPEARVLEKIMTQFFDLSRITSSGCRVLVEDQSTNCGANALKTKQLLDNSGVPSPRSMVVIQDPTMALRTIASFEKVYEASEMQPKFISCPGLVPTMREGLEWSNDLRSAGLWEKTRFLDLIMGEIPRLRDDENGYGPRGKGFISHVDILPHVEDAWRRLENVLGRSR